MAEKIGEAYIDVVARTQKLEKGLKDSQKELNKFKQTSTATAKQSQSNFAATAKSAIGLAIAVKGVQLAYENVIKPAIDFEETNNKLAVTFSKVGEQAEESIEKLVNSYGLAQSEARELLSGTGDLLTGFGFTQDKALELSDSVQVLAADLASFTNLEGGAERASKALTAALLGEREQAKALGIVIREADIQARLAEKGQKNLTGAALNQAKAQATLEIAYRQSQNAIGDFERSQNSVANQQKILKAALKDAATLIGSEFLQSLKEAGGEIKVNREAILGFARGISSVVKFFFELFKVVKNTLSEALEPFRDIFGESTFTLEKFQQALGLLLEAFKVFGSIVAKILKFVLRPIAFVIGKTIEAIDFLTSKLVSLGIVEEKSLKKLKSTFSFRAKYQKSRAAATSKQITQEKKISKERDKQLSQAKQFIETIAKLNLSAQEQIDNERKERITKLDEYRNKALISEEQYVQARIKINADAEKKIEANRIQTFQTVAGQTQNIIGQLNNLFQADTQNRLAEIDNRQAKQTEAIQLVFEQRKAEIEETITDEEKRNAALEALDQEKNRTEQALRVRNDLQKRKIERKAFERNKKTQIAESIISGATAAVNAVKSFSVIPIVGPILGIAFGATIAAITAARVSQISRQKYPALASGGITTGPTTALIGEAGQEAVLPLQGVQGRKAIDTFTDSLVNAQENKIDSVAGNAAAPTIGQPIQSSQEITIMIGNDTIGSIVTDGTRNRTILIDQGAVTEL